MALLFAKNNSLSAVTALPASVSGGGLNLISTQTASSSATIDFTSGLDSTYKQYVFKFINIHPSNNGAEFDTQASTDSGSNYNTAMTSSAIEVWHAESDASDQTLQYSAYFDNAQTTSFFPLSANVGYENDEHFSGTLTMFNPSSTVFVKHWVSQGVTYNHNDYILHTINAGYFNTSSAIDAIRFQMSAGTIDSGTIKLYGVT